MSNEIKVSIIVTTYNKLNYFKDTINSAINQNFDSYEIIVIDDNSTDGTIEELKIFEKTINNNYIKFFYMNENKGIVYCRNFGIKVARGKYILPLDGDDLITEDYLRSASDYMDNNADCGICYCQAKLFGKKDGLWNLPAYDAEKIWIQNCIFSCAMYRKSDAILVGGYDKLFDAGHEDWDFWLSIISIGRTVHRIDKVMFLYRIGNETRTKSANKILDRTTRNIFKKHINWIVNLPNSCELFFDSLMDNKVLEKKIKKYKQLTIISNILFIVTFFILLVKIL